MENVRKQRKTKFVTTERIKNIYYQNQIIIIQNFPSKMY